MSKQLVPLQKNPRLAVTVETEATIGAVLGVNLFNADGSLVTASQFATGSTGSTFTLNVAYALFVPLTRTISTTAPLTGGGALSSNLTIAFSNQSANLVFAGPNTGAAAYPTFRALVEADTTLSDITTNNATTGRHGYLKKLSNVATEYMDGTGNWSVPPGGGTGTVTSVSVVTANGVSGSVATATTTPAITITLGTLTAGTWNATTIASGFGGTGFSTYAAGDIIYASAINTLSKLTAGTNGDVLTLAAGVPTWAAGGGGGGGITALTGDVTASGSGSVAATIANDAVTYAKMQNVSAASKLLGRGGSGGSGDVEEITLGTNLSMSGTTLNASGSGGGAGSQVGYDYTASTTARSTTSTTIPVDNTIPQNTEGAAYTDLDITYTPTAATSLLEITICIPIASHSTSGSSLRLACFRDSGANAVFATLTEQAAAANDSFPINYKFVVAAGSTSATTFTWRWGVGGGTGYINSIAGTQYFGASNMATATLREIAQ